MNIQLKEGLLYVAVMLNYRGQSLILDNVLLDTGSVGTLFPTDKVLTIGLHYEMDDMAHRIRGVGGSEFVFTKRIDNLSVGELHVNNFEIEVGAMDYGFEINGIIGMDFLMQVGATIDLARLEISKQS